MARTFSETIREQANEAREGDRSTGPAFDAIKDIFESISMAVPEGLDPDSLERRNIRRGERRRDFRSILDDLLGEGIGANLQNLEDILREANDIDLSELEGDELTRFIAQVNLAQANATVASLETLITKAVFLDDIASAVEAPSTISVNGINDTGSDPEVVTEVIPESEEREFPVTRIIVRSSRTNKGEIFFGDDDISPDAGFVLGPGETYTFDLDFRDATLYMVSDDPGQEVSFMGLI